MNMNSSWVHKLCPPQKNEDFDGFSHFLEKLDIFGNIFWKFIEDDLNNFILYSQGGLTYNVPLEKLEKRSKNANFLNIHQIKKWEYETLTKNEWLRRF